MGDSIGKKGFGALGLKKSVADVELMRDPMTRK